MSDHRRPLRIGLLVRTYPALSETFIHDQIVGLRNRGHAVDVYSLYRGGRHLADPSADDDGDARYLIGPETTLGRALVRAGGRLVSSLASPGPLLRLAPLAPWQPRIVAEAIHAIPRLPRRPRYDVVHAHFGPTGLLALALRRAAVLSGAVVTTFHGFDLTRYPHEHGANCYRRLFDNGDWFTVNSGFSEARALALGAPADRLRRIPMGVDLGAFEFRERTAAEDAPVRLLSVGRLEPVKGLAYGLEAVARLVAEGYQVRYSIVGAGRLADRLRDTAERLGIAAQVRFTGPLPFRAVVEEYRAHDIFLMPGVVTEDGQQEAQGRVLVEAQASGLPVVATRVGGIPETLAGGAGVLVPPRDVDALANGVRELVEDPGQWPAMGAAGRKHVELHYGADPLLDALLDVYRSAIQHAGAAPS